MLGKRPWAGAQSEQRSGYVTQNLSAREKRRGTGPERDARDKGTPGGQAQRSGEIARAALKERLQPQRFSQYDGHPELHKVWEMNGVDLEAHAAHHGTRNMSKHRREATLLGVLLSQNQRCQNLCFVDAGGGQYGAFLHSGPSEPRRLL